MQRARWILTLGLAASLLALGVAATNPPVAEDNCQYFEETGHWVCGKFLEMHRSHGGLEIFGYPLTEAFHDPTHSGLYVQYFQRARMEWHPANPPPYDVQLGLLVDELGYDLPPARAEEIASSTGPLHHYFPETGHVVSYAFLDYYREHGGLRTFGYPRSEFMYEGGRIVQYFQRARMTWHPEGSAGSQMRLANLGEVYIEEFGVPDNQDEPVARSARPKEFGSTATAPIEEDLASDPPIMELTVSPSVRFAVTGRQGVQTLFVYVVDQQEQPVEGAAVTAAVRYPSRRQSLTLDATNEGGFTKCSFEILPTPPGKRVVIDVTATYEDLKGTRPTFFFPWW